LLDEPSAYLDIEEISLMAKIIRRVIKNRNVSAFVVEPNVVAQDFLKEMEITFRRDPSTKRPRAIKEESKPDRCQKKTGRYCYVK